MVPADDQAMVFPWASVMVIIVLLNVAFTCATPEAIFLRSRRRTRVASLPILDLLAGDGFGRPLTGAGIGMGALAADRQSATMPQPAVATEVHQPLDIHGHFAPQVPLDHIVAVDHLADLQHFLVGQLRYP